jgi:hypothetical protein
MLAKAKAGRFHTFSGRFARFSEVESTTPCLSALAAARLRAGSRSASAAPSFAAMMSWTIGEIFLPGERFTGRFSGHHNTLIGAWQRSGDGSNWFPRIDIKLTEVP